MRTSIQHNIQRRLHSLLPSLSLPLRPLSTMASTPSTAPHLHIQMISDNICPFCYLGKRKLQTALKRLPASVSVQWDYKPFQLDPTLPEGEGVDKMERYSKKFGAERMVAMVEQMKENGRKYGIEFDYGGKVGNTVNSHRLVEWSKTAELGGGQHTDALIDALFQSYFEKQGDLASEDMLVQAAKTAKLPVTEEKVRGFLRGDQFRSEVIKESSAASGSGISGVPYFIFNNKYAVSGAQEPDTFLAIFKKMGLPTQE